MASQKQQKKILWAVDPFVDEMELQRSAAGAIQSIIQGSTAIIEPIYFFSAHIMDTRTKVPHPVIREVRELGQEKLDEITKRFKLPGLRPLHVLPASHLSLREGVDQITRISKKWGADLIVTTTRARKGVNRWMIGSFAETLLLYSDVPLLMVNPFWKQSAACFRNILFPTDFSKESKEAFHQVLKLAKSIGSKITLFHKMDYLWPPSVHLTESVYALYDDVFKKEREIREREASRWTKEAKALGIIASVVIEHKQSGSIAESILAQTKKWPGMIAMAAHSGSMKTTFLGSVTRKLVRSSSYPVWVLHPQSKASQKKQPPLYLVTESDVLGDLEHIPRIKKAG